MAGQSKRVGLIAPTPGDARDVMISGESGLLSVGNPKDRPTYEPSKLQVAWPNGAIGYVRSGAQPDKVRGLNIDTLWADELASWQYARESWDLAMFALRIGDPRACITTTPKPLLLLREILQDPKTAVTTGTTFDNAENLSDKFFRDITAKYEGTSLGQQELYAALLEEAEGALWNRAMLTDTRVQDAPSRARVVIGVDPAISKNQESNETGIVVVAKGVDGHGYVLADHSGRMSPAQWAAKVAEVYALHAADRIIVETNQGGDMVRHTLNSHQPNLPVREVHATDGKRTRAEPVAAMYEQGKIHHVGVHRALEDQMCTWVPESGDPSPDRMDALVWACSELFVNQQIPSVTPSGVRQRNQWRVA